MGNAASLAAAGAAQAGTKTGVLDVERASPSKSWAVTVRAGAADAYDVATATLTESTAERCTQLRCVGLGLPPATRLYAALGVSCPACMHQLRTALVASNLV